MQYTYVVLGAGRQGVAIAYDLARNGEARQVTLVDAEGAIADAAARRLRTLVPQAADRIAARVCDVSDRGALAELLRGVAPESAAPPRPVVISAAPYRFNVALTDAALAARCHFCDLGGNTAVARTQLTRSAAAQAAGVSVVPDCGLCPGLGNHLAAHAIAQLGPPIDVHVRCGGLPQERVGPLQYKLLFHVQGLINEYSGTAEFLRDGRVVEVPTLTEIESIAFDPPVGVCEAAVTSGGTSTCPSTYAGTVRTYDYKTVRYPGHFAIMRALFQLGFLDEQVQMPGGAVVAAADLTRHLLTERLRYPQVHDLALLRVTAQGEQSGRRVELCYEVQDQQDERTGFSAMERTTGFPAALVACMQARGLIAPGARPLEVCVPAQQFVDELPQHDIHVRRSARDVA